MIERYRLPDLRSGEAYAMYRTDSSLWWKGGGWGTVPKLYDKKNAAACAWALALSEMASTVMTIVQIRVVQL